jgi:hypothetical protein
MVNKATSIYAEQLQDQRKETSEHLEADKKKRELTKDFPRRFFLQADKPYFITFLHPYEKGLSLSLHTVYKEGRGNLKGRYVGSICNKQYSEHGPEFSSCPICETKLDGRTQFPTLIRSFVAYVHNFKGETFTPEGSDKTYDVSPIRIVEVRFGKGGSNLNELIEFKRKGVFNKKLFIQKKTGSGKDTTYLPISIADLELAAEEVDTVVPPDVKAQWNDFDENQIAQRILSDYENVRWDIWDVEPPSYEAAPQVKVEEESVQVPKGRTAKELG